MLALSFVLATSLRDTSGGRVDVNPVRLAWGILQHPWVIELALRLRRWRCEACLQQIPGLRYRLRRKPRSEPFCAFYEHRLRLVHPNGLPPCLLCRREAKHFYRHCLSTIELVCLDCFSGKLSVGDSRKSICDK